MEIFENQEALRKKNKFPKYKSKQGVSAFFGYLLSILIWLGILILGMIILYTHWFSQNLIYLLNVIKPRLYLVPFWFALLLVLLPVTFPFTLLTILLATLIKIIRK